MKITINNDSFNDKIEDIINEKNIYYLNEFNKKFSNLEISTITCRFNFIEDIDIDFLYHRFPINDRFIYITYGNNDIRGFKKLKKIKYEKDIKIKKDKRKQNKGNSFSNQLIIGYDCNIKSHNHNNPVSIKIFNNGLIQMTGCKSETEIYNIYNLLYNIIVNIPNKYNVNDNIYTYNFYKKIIHKKDIKIKYDMILSQIKFNFNLNQYYTHHFLTNNKKYNIKSIYHPEISTSYSISLNDLEKNGYIPTCSVFNNSINMISNSMDLSNEMYYYIKDFLTNNLINLISFN